jgi:hypothetical protein
MHHAQLLQGHLMAGRLHFHPGFPRRKCDSSDRRRYYEQQEKFCLHF